LHARVGELCEALDARHTGCQVKVVGDDIRVVRTFSYASKRDLLITDVLRALTAPDWQRAIADAQAAVLARIAAYEEERRLEDATPKTRLGIAPNLEAST
jgi:class 3 adenylate cyclase